MKGLFAISISTKMSKVNTIGEVPLYLRITLDGQRTEISLDNWISKNNWDQNVRRVKGPGAKKLNLYIEDEISYVREIKRELDREGTNYDVSDIRNKYLGVSTNEEVYLLEKHKAHIQYMERMEGISFAPKTRLGFNSAYRHLTKFIQLNYQTSDIHINKADQSFIREYEVYLRRDAGLNHNTATKYLKQLKKVVNECLEDGIISINPFRKMKLGYKATNKEALTDEELKVMMRKQFKLEKLNRVKDIFVFCCLTGLSYVDVKNLTKDNLFYLDNDVTIIKGTRSKTDQKYVAYLLPESRKILAKYEHHPECIQKGVLLPVISNQKMNDMLKEIAAILEIDKNVTCHISRYTFITTVAISNGISQPITAAIAGHSSTRMTEAYTKLNEMEVIKQMQTLESQY